MTSLLIAFQICMTLVITSGMTYFLINYVEIKDVKNAAKYQKFLAVMLLVHGILIPLSLINLVWSY